MRQRVLFVLGAAVLVGFQVILLHRLGQPWIAADRVVRVWEGDVLSPACRRS